MKKPAFSFHVDPELQEQLNLLALEYNFQDMGGIALFATRLLVWAAEEKRNGRSIGSFNEQDGTFRELLFPRRGNDDGGSTENPKPVKPPSHVAG